MPEDASDESHSTGETSPARRESLAGIAAELLADLRRALPLPDAPTVVAGGLAQPVPLSRIGPYEVLAPLGRGGMGSVYRARDTRLGRTVALKVFESGDLSPAEAAQRTERFRREANALAKLGKHPHLVQVHELGREGGQWYFSMDLVEGITLRQWLGLKPRTPREVASMVQRTALGLAHAHAQGVVHRDVKPENVFVGEDGEPQVGDFGLVRDLAATTGITEEGQVMGTVAYMAPEQALGATDRIGPPTDVHALGVILYEGLAGAHPFLGDGKTEVLAQVLTRDPVPLRRKNPRIAPDLEAIVMRCLEKDERRRYPHAGALAEDLRRWTDGEPVSATRLTPAYWLGKKLRRHRRALLGGVALVLLGAGVVWGVTSGRRLLGEWRRDRLHEEHLRSARQRMDSAREALAKGAAPAAIRTLLGVVNDMEKRQEDGERGPMAQALVLLAEALRSAREDANALASFARAYAAGMAAPEAEEREAAAEALFALGERFEARGDFEHARGAWRTLIARFPSSERLARTRFHLACSEEALGRYGVALAQFRALVASREGRSLADSDLVRANQSIQLLGDLVPAVEQVLPRGPIAAGDLDADGRPELVLYDTQGRLHVFEDGAREWKEVGVTDRDERPDIEGGRLLIADVHGDGKREVVATWGRGFQVWTWDGKGRTLAPGPREALEAPVRALAVADLEGDGTPELLVSVGGYVRRLRVYECSRARGLALRCEQAFPDDRGSDVLALLAGGPVPRGVVVASLGPWGEWRIVPLRWDAARKRLVETDTPRWRTHAAALGALPDGRLFFNSRLEGGERNGALAGGAREEDALANGVYAVAISPEGKLGAPERIAQHGDMEGVNLEIDDALVIRLGGRERLLTKERSGNATCVRLLPLPGDSAAPRVLSRDEAVILGAAVDLRGSGRDPLVVSRVDSPDHQTLRTYGLGEAAAAQGGAGPAGTVSFEGSVGDDLLALGLAPEAEKEFERGRDDLGIGRALMDQRKWGEAVPHLRAATERRAEALRLAAECLEQERRWGELADALDEQLQSATMDPVAREALVRWRGWARQAAAMEERGRIDSKEKLTGIESDNPFLCGVAERGLVFRQTTKGQYAAGVPFRYEGGPLRVEWRTRFARADWGTGVWLGIDGETRLGLRLSVGGSGDAPTYETRLEWRSSDGQSDTNEATFRPSADKVYRTALEYVPGASRAWLAIDDGGAPITMSVEVRRTLARGTYRIGKYFTNEWREPGEGEMDADMQDIRLSAYEPATCFERPAPASPRDFLRAGNGEWILGREEAALAAYEKAISPDDKDASARALFFRAILRNRMRHADDARKDLDAARALDAAEVESLVALCLPALSEEDKAFCGAGR